MPLLYFELFQCQLRINELIQIFDLVRNFLDLDLLVLCELGLHDLFVTGLVYSSQNNGSVSVATV